MKTYPKTCIKKCSLTGICLFFILYPKLVQRSNELSDRNVPMVRRCCHRKLVIILYLLVMNNCLSVILACNKLDVRILAVTDLMR